MRVALLSGLLAKICSCGHARKIVSRIAHEAGVSYDGEVDKATFRALAEEVILSVPDRSKQEMLKTDLHEILPS